MKTFFSILFSLIILLTTSCSETKFTHDYWIMDTYCTVTLYGQTDNNTKELVSETLEKYEKELLIKDGSKSFFADADNCEIPISKDISEMLKICKQISELTEGAFDLSIAPLTKLWDIQNRTTLPTESEIESAKLLVGYKNIIIEDSTVTLLNKDTGLDIGAVGKGYAGEKAAKTFKSKGYTAGILNLGGNVTVFGENPNREDGFFLIGIKNPLSLSDIYCSVKVKDTNIVTAGGYERYFKHEGKQYHHIIDPQTGYPAENGIKSVTIVCSNGIIADALATAIYVSGTDKASDILNEIKKQYSDIAAIIYTDENSIITYNIEKYEFTTYNFEGDIYPND